MKVNRRRFVRVRAQLRFTFAWSENFELYRTEDLSAGGAQARADAEQALLPPLGAEGECAFNIEGFEVRVAGRVVRAVPHGFAVRFVGLDRAVEDRLVGWVLRQEAQALARRMPSYERQR